MPPTATPKVIYDCTINDIKLSTSLQNNLKVNEEEYNTILIPVFQRIRQQFARRIVPRRLLLQ